MEQAERFYLSVGIRPHTPYADVMETVIGLWNTK